MRLRFFFALLALCSFSPLLAQHLIEYESGIGSRNPDNPDVWILYNQVTARHEGMTLYADSALINLKLNDFNAFDNVEIILSDTTFIYGDELYYDGVSKVIDIWGDSVLFIDGATRLHTPHLSYDRVTSTATYSEFGHTTNRGRVLDSRVGYYYADKKLFFIYDSVSLRDSSMRIFTDTLYFNTVSNIATFTSPTHLFSDSAYIFSEYGFYNTATRYAESHKHSLVRCGDRILTCDTLHYFDSIDRGLAFGHVVIRDTVNDITCWGSFGLSDQSLRLSFVTDSALVLMVDNDDSLFLHADTILLHHDSLRHVSAVQAHYHVKTFRPDMQSMSDSAFYFLSDSLLLLFGNPVLWYDNYQCSADTIRAFHDSSGIRTAFLNSNVFVAQRVDSIKFNQIKGRNAVVHFLRGEPLYADILGNAQMTYYITEDDTVANQSYLIGVNCGIGSDMRGYFSNRQLSRLVTYGKPDMHTYPLSSLPDDYLRLVGFRWLSDRRPSSKYDVFRW